MDQKILHHHPMTGVYTYAGNYEAYFKSLPDGVSELCNLICSQVIHHLTLKDGNTNAKSFKKFTGWLERNCRTVYNIKNPLKKIWIKFFGE